MSDEDDDLKTVEDLRREYSRRRRYLRMDHAKRVVDRQLDLEQWRLRVYTKINESSQPDKHRLHDAIRKEYDKRIERLKRLELEEGESIKRDMEALEVEEEKKVRELEEPPELKNTAPSA